METFESKNQILDLFYQCNKDFLLKNLELIKVDVAERCLCAQLSHEFSSFLENKGFKDYFSDVEYNRNGLSIKTFINKEKVRISFLPDIIIHSRGHNELENILAIEMKKKANTHNGFDDDRKRLMALTKQDCDEFYNDGGKVLPKDVCRFMLGIFYILDIKKEIITLEIYSNGEFIHSETNSIEYFTTYQSDYYRNK